MKEDFFSASNDVKTLDGNIFSGFPWLTIQLNAKFIVIRKPLTLNDRGEDSVQYRNRKKHCFLAAAILLFIGKIIIT